MANNNFLPRETVKTTLRPIDRYPFPRLRISDIAQQAYCEKQVDLWLDNPSKLMSVPAGFEKKLPGAQQQMESASKGSDFHESVEQLAMPATWNDIKQELHKGRSLMLVETLFTGSFQ